MAQFALDVTAFVLVDRRVGAMQQIRAIDRGHAARMALALSEAATAMGRP